MGHNVGAPETSCDERLQEHMHVLYARHTRERQMFMDELKQYRKKMAMKGMQDIRTEVGPRWYQALSVLQRDALDTLKHCMYQDVIAGRPQRTVVVIKSLGLYPNPSRADLMNCISLAEQNPMQMLAHLYTLIFGLPIDIRRLAYNLNARIILSSILYLGYNNLIILLREKFRPDQNNMDGKKNKKPKPKPKEIEASPSPYLQKLVAHLWVKPEYKRPPPLPLPNLDDLDEPFEPDDYQRVPPPPPPPPPPRKKRIPQSICDKMANYRPPLRPARSIETLPQNKTFKTSRKTRTSKNAQEGKKVYGIGINFNKNKSSLRRKLKPPTTGLENAQYTINGVYEKNGKRLFILGSVSILPSQGHLIHGGTALVKNECVIIHCGFRAYPTPLLPRTCDCLKLWSDSVMEYVKNSKCYCGHLYDFGNEGTFPPEELPFFTKPTRFGTLEFKHDTIYNLDFKIHQIEKEVIKFWQTDSVVHLDADKQKSLKDEKKKKKNQEKKRDPTDACMGLNPKPEDYLKCAIRYMKKENVAARLPDIHLVPELKEWMRRRIFGPLNEVDKAGYLRKSSKYWSVLTAAGQKGFGHITPPKEPQFSNPTTWLQKQKLNDEFRTFTLNYRMSLYKSQAYVTNMFWRTMFQAEFPDKQFRAIYFSYLCGKPEDLQIFDPYSYLKVQERKTILMRKRYVCLPDGVTNSDQA